MLDHLHSWMRIATWPLGSRGFELISEMITLQPSTVLILKVEMNYCMKHNVHIVQIK
jgi:hypothetical protein